MAKLEVGKNDFQTYCIENNLEYLLGEWHPTKNGDLKPINVTYGSGRKVWWIYPYDNPKTGEHFDFKWEATIVNRVNGSGCPYLSVPCIAVWVGFNDLATTHPELSKEWHPTKNGNLKPTDVTTSSNKKVWWLLSYDDSKTGKHFDFEWEAIINYRTNGVGCPYIFGKAIWIGFNDLVTTNPEIAKEWHPTKNGNLKPTEVTAGCNKKVWWYLSYDDPNTGKHFDFEWQATINDRTNGIGCPFLSNKNVWKGFNDLVTTHPELAKEWHPTKNGNLKPTEVIAGSNKKVWWLYSYDDSQTGKHFDFEWKMQINSRTLRGSGCPYLSGRAIWVGFNDLATTHPEFTKEWHPTKNGKLKPTGVTIGSKEKVWWLCPLNHSYTATIQNRYNGNNCSICSKETKTSFSEQIIYYYIKKHFKDAENRNREILNGKELDIYIPSINIAIEYDGALYHQDIKRDEIKNILCKENDIILYRIREDKCPILKETNHLKIINCTSSNIYDLENAIKHLLILLNIVNFDININRDRIKIYNQYIISIKKQNLNSKYPELIKEWHPTKNGNLKPEYFSFGSGKKVWWYLPYDDPKTGKHFNFEWQAKISDRTMKDAGCPYLSGNAIWKGFNDLATTHPKLAKQWHPTKNNGLTPFDVTAGSNKKVWWICPYDDSQTGKHFDFEWDASINSRALNGLKCPYLSGKAVWKGFNDLATIYPQLVKEWHPTKNGNLKPTDVTINSQKKVWWIDKNNIEHYTKIQTYKKKFLRNDKK